MMKLKSFAIAACSLFFDCCVCNGQATDPPDRFLIGRGRITNGWVASQERSSMNNWGISGLSYFADWSMFTNIESLEGFAESNTHEIIIIGGKNVKTKHVEAACRFKGLKMLILDSVPFDLKLPVTNVKILSSQRLLIEELKNANFSFRKVIVEKRKDDFLSAMPDFHSIVLVEVSQDRADEWKDKPLSVELLPQLFGAVSLLHLDLGRADVGDEEVAGLAGLVKLESLWLDGTHITSLGLRAAEGLKLQKLDISSTRVIGDIPYLPDLQELKMDYLSLHKETIVDPKKLPKLRRIQMHFTKASPLFFKSINEHPTIESVDCDLEYESLLRTELRRRSAKSPSNK